MTELADKTCQACDGWAPVLSEADLSQLKAGLDDDWEIDPETQRLHREFTFKNFVKAQNFANMVGFVSEREGHHADIAFGWGYCRISYISHELGRLTENDFICAAKIDQVIR